MPYVKCVRCRIRVPDAGAGSDEGLCPNCGKPLEPVAKLAELMGYRTPSLHERRTLAALRWLDEADSFSDIRAKAVREPPPQ